MIAMEMMASKQNMVFVKSKIASVEPLVYIISIFIQKKLRLVFNSLLGIKSFDWLKKLTNQNENRLIATSQSDPFAW